MTQPTAIIISSGLGPEAGPRTGPETEIDRPTKPARRRRTITTLSLLLAFVSFLAITPSPSEATINGGGGAIGPHRANSVITCRHEIRGQFQSLAISVPPPTVWAKNYRAGANNDSGYVRYGVILVDYKTNRALSSAWSGFQVATDVRPATWNGSTFFRADALNGRMYQVEYRIEWWSSTARRGWISDRSKNYHYYGHARNGPIGLGACRRY